MAEPAFVHLHVHSSFSLLEGALRIERLVELAAADRQPVQAHHPAPDLLLVWPRLPESAAPAESASPDRRNLRRRRGLCDGYACQQGCRSKAACNGQRIPGPIPGRRPKIHLNLPARHPAFVPVVPQRLLPTGM